MGIEPAVSGTTPEGGTGGVSGRDSGTNNGTTGNGRTVPNDSKGTGKQGQRPTDSVGETGTGTGLVSKDGQSGPVGGNTGEHGS